MRVDEAADRRWSVAGALCVRESETADDEACASRSPLLSASMAALAALRFRRRLADCLTLATHFAEARAHNRCWARARFTSSLSSMAFVRPFRHPLPIPLPDPFGRPCLTAWMAASIAAALAASEAELALPVGAAAAPADPAPEPAYWPFRPGGRLRKRIPPLPAPAPPSSSSSVCKPSSSSSSPSAANWPTAIAR